MAIHHWPVGESGDEKLAVTWQEVYLNDYSSLVADTTSATQVGFISIEPAVARV